MWRPRNRSQQSALRRLAWYYRRCGWSQTPADAELRHKLGDQYKRGFELRIAVHNERELAELRRVLAALGFKPSRPFPKVHRIVQPVYGRAAVARFLLLVASVSGNKN
jgi:hypothetical protein